MKNISKEDLLGLRIPIPKGPEQIKIAQVLSAWNIALARVEQLVYRKRVRCSALAHQLLTGKRRFSRFKKKWDEITFQEVFEEIQTRNTESRVHTPITVGKYAIGRQSDKFTKSIASENVSAYWIICPGDFVYDPMSAYYGAIGRYDLEEPGIVSPAYRVQRLKPGFVSDFIKFVLKSHYVRHQLEAFSSQNNKAGKRRLLSRESFAEVSFPCPEIDEQTRIAEILSLAEQELGLMSLVLAAYRQQKKGLLQQLLTGKRRVKLSAA